MTITNFGRSIIYFIEAEYDKTLTALELLIEEFPNIPLLQRRIAQILIKEFNYEKAIPHLEKLLELDEKDLTAKVWLSLSYFKVGETEKGNIELNDLNDLAFFLKAIQVSCTNLHS